MLVGCDREIFDCADQTGFKPADIGQRWWVGQWWVWPLQTGETGEEMIDLTLTEAGANQPVGLEFCPRRRVRPGWRRDRFVLAGWWCTRRSQSRCS